MQDGWIRYKSGDMFGITLLLRCGCGNSKAWLSQANHTFSHLGITRNFQQYIFVREVDFWFKISDPASNPPKGFFFLCPAKDFRTGSVSFKCPDYPAYWSLDPSGVRRLSTEDAVDLGFPRILFFSVKISGRSWDTSAYAGLRQMHRAKGFDPDSQDVARHLGYSLYQLAGQMDASDEDIQKVGDSCAEGEVREPVSTEEREHNDVEEVERIYLFGTFPQTLGFFMNFQSFLILFIAMIWVYTQICG
ncbi:hypothetical protein C8R47DRAFT_401101 [Mycena vitilis]|nr:hypothetical protein C8R47DRAFT_401101 [Mycena vitilis]